MDGENGSHFACGCRVSDSGFTKPCKKHRAKFEIFHVTKGRGGDDAHAHRLLDIAIAETRTRLGRCARKHADLEAALRADLADLRDSVVRLQRQNGRLLQKLGDES